MTNHLSDKDWLLLSRHLAGALSSRQVVELESRLASERDLQESLEQLKRIRLLLSTCSEKSVPRNFTIKAGQTARKPVTRLFPIFRIATVVTSLLFVFVVSLRMLPIMPAGEPSRMMDMAVMSQESAVTENAVPKAAIPVEEITTLTPDARTAAGAGMLTGPSPAQEIPEEEIVSEAEFVPDRGITTWGNITWSLAIISLVLASMAVYLYFREHV